MRRHAKAIRLWDRTLSHPDSPWQSRRHHIPSGCLSFCRPENIASTPIGYRHCGAPRNAWSSPRIFKRRDLLNIRVNTLERSDKLASFVAGGRTHPSRTTRVDPACICRDFSRRRIFEPLDFMKLKIAASRRRNKTRSLSLMRALRVNSGTVKQSG